MRRGASFELKMGKNEGISRIFEPLKERESERAAKKVSPFGVDMLSKRCYHTSKARIG